MFQAIIRFVILNAKNVDSVKNLPSFIEPSEQKEKKKVSRDYNP